MEPDSFPASAQLAAGDPGRGPRLRTPCPLIPSTLPTPALPGSRREPRASCEVSANVGDSAPLGHCTHEAGMSRQPDPTLFSLEFLKNSTQKSILP